MLPLRPVLLGANPVLRRRWMDECRLVCAVGSTRKEFEYPIPLGDARELMKLAGNPVAKRRHWIDYQGFTWEVDEFLGDNVGLLAVIEVTIHGDTSYRALLETRQRLPRWSSPRRGRTFAAAS